MSLILRYFKSINKTIDVYKCVYYAIINTIKMKMLSELPRYKSTFQSCDK